MNILQAKKISIKNVLESFSLFPSKEKAKSAFYFAFDREEKTPSLSVNFVKNTAFDFGSGKSYDVISVVQEMKKCSVSDALVYLEKFNCSIQNETVLESKTNLDYEITKVIPITHPALKQYLQKRKLFSAVSFLQEIHYTSFNKHYFGIGFENDSGGFEFSNAYCRKKCLLKKDITTISNSSMNVRIFESWSDYFSYQILFPIDLDQSDFIILNSVSLIGRTLKTLIKYDNIYTFFDNDEAGRNATRYLEQLYTTCIDASYLYYKYKDLNEYLIMKGDEREFEKIP